MAVNENHQKLINVREKMKRLNDEMAEEDAECPECKNMSSTHLFLYSQIKYSQCAKIMVLAFLAMCHLYYMFPYLRVYDAYENHAYRVLDYTYQGNIPEHKSNIRLLKFQIDMLRDYKKNLWMTVGSMCVSLSITCFFLFVVPFSNLKPIHGFLMKVIDIVAFLTLPILLLARKLVVQNINSTLDMSATDFADLNSIIGKQLECNVNGHFDAANCEAAIIGSLFPVILLKYLLLLCIITAAYVFLAYCIAYCIRHWFPHSQQNKEMKRPILKYVPGVMFVNILCILGVVGGGVGLIQTKTAETLNDIGYFLRYGKSVDFKGPEVDPTGQYVQDGDMEGESRRAAYIYVPLHNALHGGFDDFDTTETYDVEHDPRSFVYANFQKRRPDTGPEHPSGGGFARRDYEFDTLGGTGFGKRFFPKLSAHAREPRSDEENYAELNKRKEESGKVVRVFQIYNRDFDTLNGIGFGKRSE
uniref:Chloride channel CLIC-like protein 1 n=1 Tax=Rhabditophanes sp. KR3021 TaxID=114890 RepID=A0AC35U8K0_9BILA